MSDPSYPAYPIAAFAVSFISLIPLAWHLEAWNAGTCLYMLWTSVTCLNLGINSVVWHGDAIDRAPIWCDISSRIIVASGVAIPMASLCINRRLYKIATLTTVSPISSSQRRRGVMEDVALGLGVPLLQIVTQYVVSGHRYDIYGEIGCFPYTYNTLPAYFLVVIWPVVIGIISAIYCVLTLRAFFQRRAQFKQFLSSTASFTANRYFRLMALATIELCCTTPIALYGMWINLRGSQLRPWISWADTHWDYSQVHQFPALMWRMDSTAALGLEMTRWSPIVCGIVFFGFFGFADEARRQYRRAFAHVKKIIPIRALSYKSSASSLLPTCTKSSRTSSIASSTEGLCKPYCLEDPLPQATASATFTVRGPGKLSEQIEVMVSTV